MTCEEMPDAKQSVKGTIGLVDSRDSFIQCCQIASYRARQENLLRNHDVVNLQDSHPLIRKHQKDKES